MPMSGPLLRKVIVVNKRVVKTCFSFVIALFLCSCNGNADKPKDSYGIHLEKIKTIQLKAQDVDSILKGIEYQILLSLPPDSREGDYTLKVTFRGRTSTISQLITGNIKLTRTDHDGVFMGRISSVLNENMTPEDYQYLTENVHELEIVVLKSNKEIIQLQ